MGNLTDRAAYLRGLAEGMGLDKEKKEHKLLLEMLGLMDEMARRSAIWTPMWASWKSTWRIWIPI